MTHRQQIRRVRPHSHAEAGGALYVLPPGGALDGKSILDLACGFGFYTRLLRQHGAGKVIGIDISPEMIRLANQHEQAEPLGITY